MKMSDKKSFIFLFFQNDLQENTYSKLEILTLELMPTSLELPGSISVSLEACCYLYLFHIDVVIFFPNSTINCEIIQNESRLSALKYSNHYHNISPYFIFQISPQLIQFSNVYQFYKVMYKQGQITVPRKKNILTPKYKYIMDQHTTFFSSDQYSGVWKHYYSKISLLITSK